MFDFLDVVQLGVDVKLNVRGAFFHFACFCFIQIGPQVCADPVNLAVTVSDDSQGINWTHEFNGEGSMYVPYLSIDVPDLGKAGVKVGVDVTGSRGELSVFLTLAACVDVGGEEVTVASKRLRIPNQATGVAGAGAQTPSAVYGAVDAPAYEKCLPSQGFKVLGGSFDFSWVTC